MIGDQESSHSCTDNGESQNHEIILNHIDLRVSNQLTQKQKAKTDCCCTHFFKNKLLRKRSGPNIEKLPKSAHFSNQSDLDML